MAEPRVAIRSKDGAGKTRRPFLLLPQTALLRLSTQIWLSALFYFQYGKTRSSRISTHAFSQTFRTNGRRTGPAYPRLSGGLSAVFSAFDILIFLCIEGGAPIL